MKNVYKLGYIRLPFTQQVTWNKTMLYCTKNILEKVLKSNCLCKFLLIKRKPKWELKRASTQYKKLGLRKVGNDIWKMERHGTKYSSVPNKLPPTLIVVSKRIPNPSSPHFWVLKKIKLINYECLIFDLLCSMTNYMQTNNKGNKENRDCYLSNEDILVLLEP